MNRVLFCSLIGIGVFTTFSVAKEPVGIKKRVAVFSFEDKTDKSVQWWNSEQTVGDGTSEMLTTALLKSGKYIVLERAKIAEIMKEQALGASGVVTEQSAAQIGKLLGVELAVFGAVTQFGYKESEAGGEVSGNSSKKLGFKGIGVGAKVQSLSATVGIDVRYVNTATGEITAAENVVKTETTRGASLSAAEVSFTNAKKFDESLVGKATRAAIDEMVGKIDKQMAGVRWSGRVVKTSESTVIINTGKSMGVSVGDVLEVYSKGEDLIDPSTGVSLGSEETKVGTIKVVADMADGKASKCELTQGSGGKAGDIVRYPKE